MSRKTLWIEIDSITLAENGATPNQGDPRGDDKRNAVLASLTYPRSGAPSVNSGQQFNIPRSKPFSPQGDFFSVGLFKEIVQDETLLQIKVTATDRLSKAEKLFLTILGSAVNAGLSVATGGLTGFLGSIAGAGVDQLKTAEGKVGDDDTFIVGQTDKILLNVDDFPADKNNPIRKEYPLIVPADIVKAYDAIENVQLVHKILKLSKEDVNGSIVLRIAAVPVGAA